MKRRTLFALAVLAPLSFLLLRQTARIGRFVEADGWLLASEDL